jgi:methyl-accepting chemotaxis protein
VKKLLWLNVGGLVMTLTLVVLLWQTASEGKMALDRSLEFAKVRALTENVQTQMVQMSDSMRGYLLDTSRDQEWKDKIAADDALVAAVEELTKTTTDSQLLALVQQIGKLDEERLNPTENKVLETVKTSKEAATALYFSEYLPIRREQMALIATLRKTAEETSTAFAAAERKNLDARDRFAVIFCGVFVLLGGGGVAWSARTTGRLQRDIARTATSLGDGAEGVLAAAQQVAQAAQTLAQGANEQAASLQHTSTTTTTLSTITTATAERTTESTRLMTDVEARVAEADQALAAMVASMHDINESSTNISRIIRTVDEIAFQTNILALNAAVEAARAGEAGLGFAVVADEVRRLAQRSAEAAHDTATLIEQSVDRVKVGTERLGVVEGAVDAIGSRVERTRTLLDEVQRANADQMEGFRQVSGAVAQIEQSTQQTAAVAEENAAASEELSAQAEMTRQLVTHLQELVGAGRTETETVQPAAVAGPVAFDQRRAA